MEETITIPTHDEINKMTHEQVIEWREKLRSRFEQLHQIDKATRYYEYRIARQFEVFEKMAFNLQNKLPRWTGISDGYK